ncbi:methylated-DNA--[protein]-cysteine S-methyltransferase [Listeria fleischmannii]|uniref:methylated-DNA--[protein]-cysteine S-methyltransferase n=1 Tax=Listeria fleischmannii TaxID=1069827 RepID=A0A841YEX8_9LIST|nr:methylated-DNA--[protein]-cysteine S-methyltransferase [Listeria fleischmannii]MBC1398826.1 methylated-DNA--[protein]-cysteine S-methyltransferase [Listeria fleischmannii]MBC1418955.1 methylated-DNA--[protein]-cysteine S-methyltransferase [Listeria fleischmannii]MBC1427079.1 methylated-DNA--[protein]-cysteine S-methyltransferase [Listeria fleischmannii]
MEISSLESPLGKLDLVVQNSYVTRISYDAKGLHETGSREEKRVMNQLKEELTAYFSGELQQFQIDFQISGTPFEQSVYQALLTIPYGEFWSYKEVARVIQNESSVRAVGQANRKNPLPILVPCHRVVQENGKLGGYNGADFQTKVALLELEMNHKNDFWT